MNVSVLLLDDEPVIREVMEIAFAEDGHQVVVCRSPAEVIELGAQSWPSLAVVDFWSRSDTALSEDEKAELRRVTSSVPTILVTSRPWAAKESAADLGVLKIVRKPFDLDEMSAVVACLVARLAEECTGARAQARSIRDELDGALRALDERWLALERLEAAHRGSRQF